jgi:alpha-beta hydrolase superfamily lysophospholipase
MRWWSYVGLAAIAFVGAATAIWFAASPPSPDGFYRADAPPRSQSGTLLAVARFEKGGLPGARVYRILFTTTRADGEPAVASGLVIVPAAPQGGLRPVVAWAHGTTGIARGCAPSLAPKPFAHVPGLEKILAEGWVFVATDYVGLGAAGQHAYLVGREAAHSVLDAVRAARQVDGASLSDEVVAWGHSQGGNSVLWVGSVASSYAPELNLRGIVAFAPASDLPALVAASGSTAFGKIVSSFLIRAYAAAYPDIRVGDYVRPWPAFVSHDIASRCVGGWPTLVSVAQGMLLPSDGIFARDPTTGALGNRLRENTPRGAVPSPVLILQGDADDLVFRSVQDRYVAERCAEGQPLEYRTYPDRDHVSLVADDSPAADDALKWSERRMSGSGWRSGCAM